MLFHRTTRLVSRPVRSSGRGDFVTMSERQDGHSALRWNKQAQALETFDPHPSIYQEKRPSGSNADEWHLFLCRYLDNRAMFPTGLTYVAVQIAEAIESRSLNEKSPWECAGRKQSLPEPGECDWPNCGCDPHATKVIGALIEQGWKQHL